MINSVPSASLVSTFISPPCAYKCYEINFILQNQQFNISRYLLPHVLNVQECDATNAS